MKNITKIRLKFTLVLLFIYIILFEFILPSNSVLPKPSLVVESFQSLWNDYNLFGAFASTVSVIYGGLLIVYLLIYLTAGMLLKFFKSFGNSIRLFTIFKYLPLIFFVIAFLFWFNYEWWIELILLFILINIIIIRILLDKLTEVKYEYIEAAMNIIDEKEIYSKVIWKCLEPKFWAEFSKVHFTVWGTALLFEFISGTAGIGALLKSAFEYNDFSGIVTLGFITAFIVWLGDFIVSASVKKIIHWEQ